MLATIAQRMADITEVAQAPRAIASAVHVAHDQGAVHVAHDQGAVHVAHAAEVVSASRRLRDFVDRDLADYSIQARYSRDTAEIQARYRRDTAERYGGDTAEITPRSFTVYHLNI